MFIDTNLTLSILSRMKILQRHAHKDQCFKVSCSKPKKCKWLCVFISKELRTFKIRICEFQNICFGSQSTNLSWVMELRRAPQERAIVLKSSKLHSWLLAFMMHKPFQDSLQCRVEHMSSFPWVGYARGGGASTMLLDSPWYCAWQSPLPCKAWTYTDKLRAFWNVGESGGPTWGASSNG